ncbi:NADP-dependent oxidoreductase domain-containing protein [Melampsora americana]|nr:NADP-dependent oxidoreductase domain-containing protein [Melampsora americana]
MAWLRRNRAPVFDLAVLKPLTSQSTTQVSPLCLSAMSSGSMYGTGDMVKMNKESTFELLDEFVKLGGNFIDAADTYQQDESELWIGEWMRERQNREKMVITTKYTAGYKGDGPSNAFQIDYGKTASKPLDLSISDSLERLGTDYIDILYLHWWDWTGAIEDMMEALDLLVKKGKVRFLGVSETPPWIVYKANHYARNLEITPFSVYQGQWNTSNFDREILPLCVLQEMAFCPWGTVDDGRIQFNTDVVKRLDTAEKSQSTQTDRHQSSQPVLRDSPSLLKICKDLGAGSVTAVALIYIVQKNPYIIPIIGGSQISDLHSNIKALSLRLTPNQIKELEKLKQFGFPYSLLK